MNNNILKRYLISVCIKWIILIYHCLIFHLQRNVSEDQRLTLRKNSWMCSSKSFSWYFLFKYTILIYTYILTLHVFMFLINNFHNLRINITCISYSGCYRLTTEIYQVNLSNRSLINVLYSYVYIHVYKLKEAEKSID